MTSSETTINVLLKEWHNGNIAACDEIFPLVYQELSRIAHKQLNKMWNLNTINTTVLVHEAYIKMIKQPDASWENRAHFLAVSATAMRHILINYAEQKRSDKRGGDWQQVTLEEAIAADAVSNEMLLAVEGALKHLSEIDERLGKLVEMRFFGGMTEEEIACVLGVTDRTVRRDWRKAKALLSQALTEHNNDREKPLG